MFANRIHGTLVGAIVGLLLLALASTVAADETCNSPYMGNLIKGQEDYLYVWALGVKGMGDGMRHDLLSSHFRSWFGISRTD